jgi:phospholipid-binding lipoprotein MlaA
MGDLYVRTLASSILVLLLLAAAGFSIGAARAEEPSQGATTPDVGMAPQEPPPAEPPTAGPLVDEAPDPLFDEEWVDDTFDDEWVDDAGPTVADPLEGSNRAILGFNQRVDDFLLDPLTDAYRFVVPKPASRSLRRVFTNLNTPVYFMNNLFQLRPHDAAETLGACIVNSTFGLGGILDASSAVYLQPRPADFGQTLAVAGVGHGPYLVVPLFGPTTVRDGFGGVVDFFMHPATYFLGIPTLIIWGGSDGVLRREAVADQLEALEESSVDYYSVLRSAYVQARHQSVENSRRRRIGADQPDDDAGPVVAGSEPALF